MILGILVVLPHINEFKRLVAIELALHLFNRTFPYVLPSLFNELHKSLIMFHQFSRLLK